MTDLRFDPELLDEDLIAPCRISAGPRRRDPEFQPEVGDTVLVDDGAGEPMTAFVVARADDVVWIQLPAPSHTLSRLIDEAASEAHAPRRRRRCEGRSRTT